MVFASFLSFGFGGSRRGCAAFALSFPLVCQQLRALLQPRVLVSSAAGVSASVRAAFPFAQVFAAGSGGSAPAVSVLVARGAALVRALAAAPAPLWLCWPGCACPAFVRPSSRPARCWCGGGSGSWAECAFAAGLGVPVLVFLPAGVAPPASWGAWQPCWGGWLLRPAPALL